MVFFSWDAKLFRVYKLQHWRISCTRQVKPKDQLRLIRPSLLYYRPFFPHFRFFTRIQQAEIQRPKDTTSSLEWNSIRQWHEPKIDELNDRPDRPVGFDCGWEKVYVFLLDFRKRMTFHNSHRTEKNGKLCSRYRK
jgi:hypothetical protein